MNSSKLKTSGKEENITVKDFFMSFNNARNLMYNSANKKDFMKSKHLLETLEAELESIHKQRSSNPQLIFLSALINYELAEWYLTYAKKWETKQDEKKGKRHLEKAWKLAQEAAALDKSLSEAYWLIAESTMRLIPFKGWRFAAIHGAKAREAILNSIRLNQRNPRAYIALAKWYFFTPKEFGGDLERAIQILRKATQLEASNHEKFLIHFWLGQIFFKKQDKLKAYNEIKKALLFYPNNILAKILLDKTR